MIYALAIYMGLGLILIAELALSGRLSSMYREQVQENLEKRPEISPIQIRWKMATALGIALLGALWLWPILYTRRKFRKLKQTK